MPAPVADAAAVQGSDTTPDLWIFGYGSLMWRPGFDYVEARRARLTGYRRCFCVYSMHHRGSEARPGLVLGLDRGGDCEGMAFRVAAAKAVGVRAYLRERELIYGVYREALLPVALHAAPDAPEAPAMAVAYIVERAHPSYAGRLPVARQARLIRSAEGISGANLDYLVNTVCRLRALAIPAPELERVLVEAGPLAARRPADVAGHPRALALMRASRRHAPIGPRLKPEQRRRFLYRWRIGMRRSSMANGLARI